MVQMLVQIPAIRAIERLMAVTIRDVAQQAGVSPMTVSRVINGSTSVNDQTRTRVEQVITALGYVPNNLARSLSQQTSGTLGVLVPDVANPFFMLILRGIESVARQHGFRVMLCNTESDLKLEDAYIQDILAHRIEGLIIAPTSDHSRRHLRLPQQYNIPIVLVDRHVDGIECDVVVGDNVGGAQRLTEHLLAVGHRRIAMICGPLDVSTARDRLQGYRQALELAGIAFDDEYVVETAVNVRGGTTAIADILKLTPRPQAIFAVNNLVAVGAVQALRQQGISVPRDMALACFEDIELASQLYPFLTVMAQPAETFGTIAAQLLIERITGRTSDRPRRVALSPELVVRVSSGKAA